MSSEPDLVEFLVPDERAFADDSWGGTTFVGFDRRDHSDPFERGDADPAGVGDRPRPRWLSAATGLGLTGLFVGGVVAASPWADDAASAPTTTVAAVPAPATTLPLDASAPRATVELAASRTGWLLDPIPDDRNIAFVVRGDEHVRDQNGWGEVWGVPGATRTTGRWFSLTLLPFREIADLAVGWSRVDVAGRPGVTTTGPDGVVTLAYDAGQLDAARLITIDSFGLDLAALVELADSIAIVDDRPQLVDDRPEFTRPELLVGFEQVAAGRTDGDLTTRVLLGGPPRTSAFYGGPDRLDLTVVQQQPAELVDPRLVALSFHEIPPLPDGWGPNADFSGDELVIGRRTIDGFHFLVARWRDGDARLSLLTTGDLADLLGMLPSVRSVSAEEWGAAERQADSGRRPAELVPRVPPAIEVGAGRLSNGRDWLARYWDSSDEWEVRSGSSLTFSELRHPEARIEPVALLDATMLIGRSSRPGATLVVTTADGTVTSSPLDVLIDPALEVFAEPGPAGALSWAAVMVVESTIVSSAEVVAADGTIEFRHAPGEASSSAGAAPASGG